MFIKNNTIKLKSKVLLTNSVPSEPPVLDTLFSGSTLLELFHSTCFCWQPAQNKPWRRGWGASQRDPGWRWKLDERRKNWWMEGQSQKSLSRQWSWTGAPVDSLSGPDPDRGVPRSATCACPSGPKGLSRRRSSIMAPLKMSINKVSKMKLSLVDCENTANLKCCTQNSPVNVIIRIWLIKCYWKIFWKKYFSGSNGKNCCFWFCQMTIFSRFDQRRFNNYKTISKNVFKHFSYEEFKSLMETEKATAQKYRGRRIPDRRIRW